MIVHHAIIQVIKPILMKGMYEHSYASIPGRGLHKSMKFVKKWIQKDKRNTKYCLKLDITKFFDNIDQKILRDKLKKIIRDKKFFSYLEEIITAAASGLPLGFTTSQWFANFYLTDFDHWIKEELGIKYYIRYMDDIIIFGSNKRKLHKIKDKIENFLAWQLNLKIKNNWQLFPIKGRTKQGRFLDFLGFKFYREHIGLRQSIALKAMRKAKRIKKKEDRNIYDARQIVVYSGLAKYANCYQWFNQYINQIVNIRIMKRKISLYDRRRNLNEYVV